MPVTRSGVVLALMVVCPIAAGCERGTESAPAGCLVHPTWHVPLRLAAALDQFTRKTGREIPESWSQLDATVDTEFIDETAQLKPLLFRRRLAISSRPALTVLAPDR